MRLKLFQKEIPDPFSRENFARVEGYVRDDPFSKGHFVFFEHSFTAASVSLEIPHGLNFQPLDVIQLAVYRPDGVTVTWHYDDFTRTNLVVSTSGACTVRAYIGRYGET